MLICLCYSSSVIHHICLQQFLIRYFVCTMFNIVHHKTYGVFIKFNTHIHPERERETRYFSRFRDSLTVFDSLNNDFIHLLFMDSTKISSFCTVYIAQPTVILRMFHLSQTSNISFSLAQLRYPWKCLSLDACNRKLITYSESIVCFLCVFKKNKFPEYFESYGIDIGKRKEKNATYCVSKLVKQSYSFRLQIR